MPQDSLNRPAKRSTPITQILRSRELNISHETQNQKNQNASLKQKRKNQTDSQFTNINATRAIKVMHTESTSLEKLFATSIPSNGAKSHKFKIFQDFNFNDDKKLKSSTLKVSNVLKDFPTSNQLEPANIPPRSPLKFSLEVDESSLLHKFQLPLLHLDNWYKIHQFKILIERSEFKSDIPEDIHEVIKVERFNELLLLVRIRDHDMEREALLVNYRQTPLVSAKVLSISTGDRIIMKDGIDVVGKYKLYKNWKLLH